MAVAVELPRVSVGTPVPSDLEYQDVLDQLQHGYDALEGVVWRLDGVGRETAVTLTDIGALWSFCDGVEVQLRQMGRMRDSLARELVSLNCLRLDTTTATRDV